MCPEWEGAIACPRLPCMVNTLLATVTEGHQRNVLKTPPRRISFVPATLTITSGWLLLQTIRPGATPSTRSSLPLRTPAEPTSGRNATGGWYREPQQSYQTRPLTADTAAGLICLASALLAISMAAVDIDSLLRKSSFTKSSQEGEVCSI